MTTNEFIPVVFNDGEPLDPTKLNNLVKNVNNVYQSASLANQTNSDGTKLSTPVIFTGRVKFSGVKSGTIVSDTINFGQLFNDDELKAGKVYVSLGVRAAISAKDSISASISGATTTTPKIYCAYDGDGTSPNINIDVIAVCMREVV
jgi:hypothetical protein